MAENYTLLIANLIGISTSSLRIGVSVLILILGYKRPTNILLFAGMLLDGILGTLAVWVSYRTQVDPLSATSLAEHLQLSIGIVYWIGLFYLVYILLMVKPWRLRTRVVISAFGVVGTIVASVLIWQMPELFITPQNLHVKLETGQIIQSNLTSQASLIYLGIVVLPLIMLVSAWVKPNSRGLRYPATLLPIFLLAYNFESVNVLNLLALFVAFTTMGFAYVSLEQTWYSKYRNANTALKKHKVALQIAQEKISKKVADRTEELDENMALGQELAVQLRAQLKSENELNTLKASIIRTISHEFRTPLTVISNAVQLLNRYADRMTPVKQTQQKDRIETALRNLYGMLTDVEMVEAANQPNRVAEYRSMHFNSFSSDLAKRLFTHFDTHDRLSFNYPADNTTQVDVDTEMITFITQTLISNALKYSPVDQPVRVEISMPQPNAIAIAIHDQGVGILPEEQNSIFEMFTRGSNIEERSGLGLGLYLAKTAIEVLQGSLTVESAGHAQGATFKMLLPLRHAPQGIA